MQIRNLDFLWKPKEIKIAPNRKDGSKYCRHHRDHSHNTNDCFDLKEEIESFIQRGYLKDFVKRKERINIQNEASTDAPQNIAAITPEHIKNQEVAGRAPIRTIFGGLAGGGDSNKAQKAHVLEIRAASGPLPVNLWVNPQKKLGWNIVLSLSQKRKLEGYISCTMILWLFR